MDEETKTALDREDQPVLLIQMADEEELRSAAASLARAGIVYYARDRESGAYMRLFAGRSLYGTDLYVARRDVVRAKNVLAYQNEAPFDQAQLLQAYDQFMESRDEDELTEEELARKDGGSYKGFFLFLGAFAAFFLVLLLLRVL